MRSVFAILLISFCVSSGALAQPEHKPTPSPELKKLDRLVGTWKTQAIVKPGPMGAGGSFTSTDRYEWQKGGFFLLIHIDYKSFMGDGVEESFMGYDSQKQALTYDSFNSSGEHSIATGIFSGETLTWTAASGPLHWRYTEKFVSPTSLTILFEVSLDGTTWNTFMEGTSTRQ